MTDDTTSAQDQIQDEDRSRKLDDILVSPARHKLIVAGPGTGKTHTFKELLQRIEGRGLAITFIIALANDLNQALGLAAEKHLADVYTFHGFCRRLLHQIPIQNLTAAARYYPPLSILTAMDIELVDETDMTSTDVRDALLMIDDASGIIPLILRSGTYYDACGHDEAVYRVYRSLEADLAHVPAYPVVLVDEYQDFSPLEVELLHLVEKVNPILVVGDDDQALYGFRHANAQFIRQLAASGKYQRFELPWCSRCTAVMVAATHTVIARAQAIELLTDRIDKAFQCFMPKKRADSERYPKLIHAKCSVQAGSGNANYAARYVDQRLDAIPAEEIEEAKKDGDPTILILGPGPYVTDPIFSYLAAAGRNVKRKVKQDFDVHALDGYLRLMHHPRSRLGWRIILHAHPLRKRVSKKILKSALLDGEELVDLLPDDYRATHLKVGTLIASLQTGEQLPAADQKFVTEHTHESIDEIMTRLGWDEEEPPEPVEPEEPAEVGGPEILVTTLQGAKGLQAAHVFVVGMTEGDFPRHDPTEEEVCCLIVALTRGTKSCTFISAGRFSGAMKRRSRFLEWLAPHIETIEVDRHYFRAIGP